MKLLTKTSLVYLLSTSIVFLIGGLIFYYNLRNIIDEETDEKLAVQKMQFTDFVKQYDSIPPLSYEHDGIEHLHETVIPVIEKTTDTSFFSEEENEMIPFRQLEFPVKYHGKNYSVTIAKPLFESEDLIETILSSFAIIAAVLLVVTLLVNSLVSRKIWKPFLKTVEHLNQFEAGKEKTFEPVATSTTEFRALNADIRKMTEKISADFRNLKAFTENASHEIQTPLSVILNTTELLLQQESLNEKQAEQIQRVNDSARKLSRMNQTLLLLSKINNGQFIASEKIDLGEIIDNRLELFSDLIEMKQIKIRKEFSGRMQFAMHPALAESLISNLLTNAIRHTAENSDIGIFMNENRVEISNPGPALQHPEKIFERFYKENPSSESTGLGLAIVRQIAETCGLKISYSYRENRHCFEVQN